MLKNTKSEKLNATNTKQSNQNTVKKDTKAKDGKNALNVETKDGKANDG